MPRFFFHVMDGRALIDHEGTEVPDAQAARAEALRTAGEILRSEGTSHWAGDKWQMTVADEKGNTVFSLSFEVTDYGR
ncbi:MAG TPA: hypothetical protein VGN97_19370 [Mesorhizobium sp.]|jgi:hypothetical protein|nr:hypothetical protein [Mesorhizobium sp.]